MNQRVVYENAVAEEAILAEAIASLQKPVGHQSHGVNVDAIRDLKQILDDQVDERRGAAAMILEARDNCISVLTAGALLKQRAAENPGGASKRALDKLIPVSHERQNHLLEMLGGPDEVGSEGASLADGRARVDDLRRLTDFIREDEVCPAPVNSNGSNDDE